MGGQRNIHLSGTLSTLFGTEWAVLLATLAVTHQTCHGSTGDSTQPPMMTLKWCRDEAAYNEDIGVELFELYVY